MCGYNQLTQWKRHGIMDGGRTGLMPSSHSPRAGLTVNLLGSPLNNHQKKISQVGIARSGLACYLEMLVHKTFNFTADPVGREVASQEILRGWGGNTPEQLVRILVASESSENSRVYGRLSTLQHKNSYKTHLIPPEDSSFYYSLFLRHLLLLRY